MPYTCEVCGAVTEAKYGSGRFCRSECAKKYSSLVALEKRMAKLGGKPDAAPPADTRAARITPPTVAVPATPRNPAAASSYTAEEQARASKPPYAPTPPVIVNMNMPETVNIHVSYQKKGRTREQSLKRAWGDMNVIRQEIERQFQPRWDMWRI